MVHTWFDDEERRTSDVKLNASHDDRELSERLHDLEIDLATLADAEPACSIRRIAVAAMNQYSKRDDEADEWPMHCHVPLEQRVAAALIEILGERLVAADCRCLGAEERKLIANQAQGRPSEIGSDPESADIATHQELPAGTEVHDNPCADDRIHPVAVAAIRQGRNGSLISRSMPR
jgi:hypothetical protein